MEIRARFISKSIDDALKVSPIVFLNGPRQAGKTTLVRSLDYAGSKAAFPLRYISLDSATQLAAAVNAPEAFLTESNERLIIDEIQLAPELFRALKLVVDEFRVSKKGEINGRYLLTGSANILALPKLSEPLVGRMAILTLYPFSTAEATGGKGNGLQRVLAMDFSGISDRGMGLIEAIQSATFPEISDKSVAERSIWFDGYLNTILQRDVRMLADLEKISILPNLLRVLSVRAGGLLNDSDISREVGLNSVTGKFYRNILKMMFLTVDVLPWHRNIGKRLVKSAKGFLIDSMLLCHMLDLNLEDLARTKPDLFGHVLENYVATELLKQLTFNNIRAQLLHFRTSDGKEVDFVLERPDGTIFAIEVKRGESVTMQDFNGINLLASLAGKDFTGGVILYGGKAVVPFGKNLWAVPFHVLWQ